MQLTERERHDAYDAMAETFGSKTDIVIAMLQPATNLATKDDLAAAIAPLATKDEVAAAVAPLATKAEVAAAVAPLATKAELSVLASDLRIEMANLSTTLERRINEGFQQQTRALMFMILGAVLLVILTNALQTSLG